MRLRSPSTYRVFSFVSVGTPDPSSPSAPSVHSIALCPVFLHHSFAIFVWNVSYDHAGRTGAACEPLLPCDVMSPGGGVGYQPGLNTRPHASGSLVFWSSSLTSSMIG